MDYKQTNITYKGLTDGKLTVSLLDSNDKKWQIWKKDYNNPEQDSEAYSALQNYKFGDTFGISYGESEESFVNDQGKNINFTKRTIYSILPLVKTPEEIGTKPFKEYTVEKPQQTENREDFGRRLAIHGMVNGLLAGGVLPNDIDIPELIKLEDRINEFLAGKIDDLDVSDIPF